MNISYVNLSLKFIYHYFFKGRKENIFIGKTFCDKYKFLKNIVSSLKKSEKFMLETMSLIF